jgi:hypothetical protein
LLLYAGIFTYNGFLSIGGNIYLKSQRINRGVVGGKDFGAGLHYILMALSGILQVVVVQI